MARECREIETQATYFSGGPTDDIEVEATSVMTFDYAGERNKTRHSRTLWLSTP